MFRISNTVVGILNILTLLIGVSAISCSICFYSLGANATDCQNAFRYPLLTVGLFLVVASSLGIVGSFFHVNVAMHIYIFVTFLFIIGLIVFAVFVELATNKKLRQKVAMSNRDETRLELYSDRLQRYVLNEKEWHEVKSCLIAAHLCRNLPIVADGKTDPNVFNRWSKVQSGCCKPPVYCEFKMKNATFWEVPKRGPAEEDVDCKRWSNEQNRLCYDCNSCKGGVLSAINHQLKHLHKFNICMLILITTIYVLSCYALKNNCYNSRHRSCQT